MKHRDAMTTAICKEINRRAKEVTWPVESIYFGGGSPSVLSQNQLGQIFNVLSEYFDLSKTKEITLESNPDDHNPNQLEFWKSLGINRLSIGIQSFVDRDLKFMNRAHNAQHALTCVELARKAGFDALTIDLIYGIPNQSMSEWQQNVQYAIDLGVEHISAYCLTVESKTVLAHQVEKGVVSEKSDEIIEAEYLYLHQTLEADGYEHYELSNFARPTKRAIHNANYWQGKPYVGFGPSAHSYDGKKLRQWNVSNNAVYIKGVEHLENTKDSEILDERELFNEKLMTGLRTSHGFSFDQFPLTLKASLQANIKNLSKAHQDTLLIESNTLKINPLNWLVSDAIIRELMVMDPI